MNNLFESNNKIIKSEEKRIFKAEEKQAINEGHNKEYCFTQIKQEMYLWDMRTWKKKKEKYSIKEIVNQINKWIKNDELYNCGHVMYCINLLIKFRWSTKIEIAKAILQNNNIQYADKIGTW